MHNRGDIAWSAQLQVYPDPCPVQFDRVWTSPLGGREYTIPAHVEAIFGHDCAGQPIVRRVRDSDKVLTSLDLRGYERQRGVQEAVVRYRDGSAVLGQLKHGEWRGYRKPDREHLGDWIPDPSAIAEAFDGAGASSMPVVDTWRNVSQARAIKAWVVDYLRGDGGSGLYCHGGPGSGKTTACRALCRELTVNGRSSLHLDVPDLARQIRAGYGDTSARASGEALVQDAYRVDVLILDDLTAVPKKDDLWLTLHTLLDRRQFAGLPVVVADNCRPADLGAAGLDARVVSRLAVYKPLDFGVRDWRRA
jgi:hypothetical protein